MQLHLHDILDYFLLAAASMPSLALGVASPYCFPGRRIGPTAMVTFGGTGALSFSHRRVAAARCVIPRTKARSAARVFSFPVWLANYVTNTWPWPVSQRETPTFPFPLWLGAPRTRFPSRMRTHYLGGFSARSRADGLPYIHDLQSPLPVKTAYSA